MTVVRRLHFPPSATTHADSFIHSLHSPWTHTRTPILSPPSPQSLRRKRNRLPGARVLVHEHAVRRSVKVHRVTSAPAKLFANRLFLRGIRLQVFSPS